MATLEEIRTWRGREAVGTDGERIGRIDDIYLDRQSGEPEWVAVKTGLFGMNVSFVPLQGASGSGDAVRLGFDKPTVKDAPNVAPDGELSPDEERRLYDHYGRADYGDWTDQSDDRTEAFMGRDERVGRGERFDTDPDRDRGDDVRGFTDDGRGRRPRRGRRARHRRSHGPRVGRDRRRRRPGAIRRADRRRGPGRTRLRRYVVTEVVETSDDAGRESL
jgi:sporulation protein YlmC with PRC-barrel domain